MEQLEKRKKDFIAKGYFNPDYKKSIPKYPKNLYVITSETGAVIQDIIHRIEARYPLNIFIVPVKVQGQGAEIEIANAISLVNEIKDQKADVIIIARGGGSIEDLWCFNEEIIVKAVFDSKIPIISAIGHETDTTLIDYAADLRAPTPTAAAELATPIAAEIKQCLINIEVRLTRFIQSKCNDEKERISIITRFLMQNDRILQEKYQKTDDLIDSLNFVIRSKFDKIKNKTENLCFNLKTPSQIFDLFSHKISNYFKFIQQNCANLIKNKENNLSYLTINQNILLQKLKFNKIKIDDLSQRIENAFNQKITYFHDRTANLDKFLSSLSYKNTLKRGFSIIRDDQNQIVKSAKNDFNNKELLIEFFDDKIKLNVSKKNN